MDHADAVKESVINHRRKIHTFLRRRFRAMDHFTLFYKRLTQLRNKQAHVPTRVLFRSSESYINIIENGKMYVIV